MITIAEHFLTFGDIIQIELAVNMQTFLHVSCVRHVGTTVTQVTVISGLGVRCFVSK